ncbi:thiosulfate oxidation carrier complex protein SoxZ [Sedimenticola selenatireducens]|uniref:thiosulfate oxidation carrier complex protein SoxZ n=1 Tax=Sedimenticola selenatireducens TaxID=191960 RepID=UPI000490AD45|nr:thiosulfate oxidation carrier complex protein SoxZ [Sedimenticola selenatireducens]
MSNTIKVRTNIQDGLAVIRLLIKHPMTIQRLDPKTGKEIPAHFIDKINIAKNGESLINANWGQGVSKNPYLSFTLTEAKKGDRLLVSWHDNKGETDSTEFVL